MELLDYNEWPIGAARVASICGVNIRTAQRWLSGETKPPISAIRLVRLTQRERIMPDSWPNHWRINSAQALDIGHTKIALSTAQIEWYFHSTHCWHSLLRLLPEIEAHIDDLLKRLPAAEVIYLDEYRKRLQELKTRKFLLLSDYSVRETTTRI